MINLLHLQIFAILALLSISCAYALFQTRNTSLNQNIAYKIRLNKFDFLNILLIIVISFCISIPHLGERAKKASYYSLQSNDQLELNFAKPTTLKQINLYIGNLDGDFKVYVANKNIQQIELLEVKTDSTHPLNYRWLSYGVNSQLQFNKLWIRTTIAPIEIKQIALFDNSNRYITDVAITSNQTIKPQNLLITKHVPLKIINTPQNTMIFDEVYYAKTALDYLHKIAPTLSENPHLSTFIIAAGIAMFGETPFGWRIMPLLCGILVLIIVYLFALQLFRQRKIALVAAFLLMFDFMHFTINRYALIDSMVTLFICAEYLMLFCYIENQKLAKLNSAQNNLWGIALFFALALATKWIALFSLLAILPIIIYYEFFYKKPQFKHQLAVSDNVQNAIRKSNIRSTLKLAYLSIFVIILYSMSFIPQYATQTESQNFISFIIQQHLAMWHYHTTYAVTHHHQFESPWWSWFLMLRPQRIYSWMNYTTKEYSSIVLMGNPAIWWFSIVAILIMMINFVKTRSWQLGFILLAIASQYLPYMLLKRTSFIYYLYSVTPFMILAITWALDAALKRSEKSLKRLVCIYLILVIGLFILFYPAISGLEIHRDYTYRYLLWYQSWDF